MRKLVIAASIVVIFVAALGITLWFNLGRLADRNKGRILARVEHAIGRRVEIGEVRVTLRGGIGVDVKDVRLADDPAFSAEPFITADALQVNVRILPLFKKRFEIRRVVLRHPVIRVIRDGDGRLNVETLAKPGSDGAIRTTRPQPDVVRASVFPAAVPGGSAPTFAIGLVDLEDGELHYLDTARGLDIVASRIDSRVENVRPNAPVTVQFGAALLSDRRNVHVSATIALPRSGGGSPPVRIEAKVGVEIPELQDAVEMIPEWREAMPSDLSVRGTASIEAQVDGTWPGLSIDIELDGSNAAAERPGRFVKPAGVPLSMRANGRADKTGAVFSDVNVAFHELRAVGRTELRRGTPPVFSARFDAGEVPLAGWSDLFPSLAPYDLGGTARIHATIEGAAAGGRAPRISGTASVQSFGATWPGLLKPVRGARAEITFTEKTATVRGASGRIGGTTIRGTADIESFEPLVLRYSARAAAVALADFQKPDPKADKPDILHDVSASGRLEADPVPSGRGVLESPRGTVSGFDYKNLKATYIIRGNEIELQDVETKALQGTLHGSGRIDRNGNEPSFTFESHGRDLNVVELFDRIPNLGRKYLRGRANIDLTISGRGTEWSNVQETVSGDGLAEFFAGEIIDFNLFDNVVQELSAATGQSNWISQAVRDKYPRVFKTRNTPFKDFKSTFVVEDGKLKARHVTLDAGDYSLLGQGALDFTGGLDLHVTLVMSNALSNDLVNDFSLASLLLNKQGRIEVLFDLTGNLPHLRAKPDPDFVKKVIGGGLMKKGFDFIDPDAIKNLFGRKRKTARRDSTPPSPR